MMKIQKTVAAGIIGLLFLNAGSVFAADASAELLASVKTLQASIDSGAAKPGAAVDVFAKTIVDKNISLNDVNTFVKTQMTPNQYTKYQSQMDSTMRGIDPSSLSSTEMGQMVGQSLAQIHTEGLYWSGCANVWTGAALITAAIVAGAIAIVKGKSVAAIQESYNNKITNTRNAYNQDISDTQNWQTQFPLRIKQLNGDIQNEQGDISYLESEINGTTDQNLIQQYQNQINSDESQINNDEGRINNYLAKMVIYANDPAQVQIDIQAYTVERDAAIANLTAQEKAAIGDAPANQHLAEILGIGAGVGAAVGAGMLYYGLEEGACGY